MGITTYLFHRSACLDEQRFNLFFLDMGENIHIHYRDLRIELSVPEFIELSEQFSTFAKQVRQEIENGYQDGVLANTNEVETLKTFWDRDNPLQHPVKYHEKHLAIEETKDGYHLHIRNYKILLGKEPFRAFARAMAEVDLLLRQDQLQRDPATLLEQNELKPKLLSRTQTGALDSMVIAVEKTYRKKASQVLRAIGYSHEGRENGGDLFRKAQSTVLLVDPAAAATAVASPAGRDQITELPNFLATYGPTLNPNELNELKLRILYLVKQAEQGRLNPFRLQDIYVKRDTLTPTIDLFTSRSSTDPAKEIESFTKLLTAHSLFFIKPTKHFLPTQTATAVQDAFFRFIHETIACHDYVRKIVVLGSSTTKRLGTYQVPFVHFDWAKINSDFDIYVELDPDYEGPLPQTWQKKFYWSRAGSDYYHFGDVGNGQDSDYAKRYPGIRFYEYLVEGYVFNYRNGDRKRRDTWLEEIKGQCIFKRDRIAQWVSENYPLQARDTEPISIASFNRVYRVQTTAGPYVLKRYGGTYLSGKDRERIGYELSLLNALRDSNLEIALPVNSNRGAALTQWDNEQAALFTHAPGAHAVDPNERQIRAAGHLLARFHLAAQPHAIKRAKKFSNKEPLIYWSDAWQSYHADAVVGTEIDLDIDRYHGTIQRLSTPAGHCHGDLSVVNYLFTDEHCWLIDFQSICYGPLIVDLANGMIEFSARKNHFIDRNLALFREGYESVRPLTDEECRCLTDLLIIQAIVRQAKLIRLHFGGFGYDLKKERLLGLKLGIDYLLTDISGSST